MMLFTTEDGTLRWLEMGPRTGCLLPPVLYVPILTQRLKNMMTTKPLPRWEDQTDQRSGHSSFPNHRTFLSYEDRWQEAEDSRVTLHGHKWLFAGEGKGSQPCWQDVVYKKRHLAGKSTFPVKFNLEKLTYLHVWTQEFKMLTFIW